MSDQISNISDYRRKRNRHNGFKRIKNYNRRRMGYVLGILFCMIGILIARLLYINATNSNEYSRIVMAQMNYDSTSIPFKRGDIKDRNGTVVATSEKVYNLVLDPYVVLNSNGDCEDPTAEAIEKFFDIDASEVKAEIEENPDSRYVVLLSELDYNQVRAFTYYISDPETDEEGNEIEDEVYIEETVIEKKADTEAEEDDEAEEEIEEDETDEEETESEESITYTTKKVRLTERADEDTRNLIKGVWFEEKYVRNYPYDSLASTVIGFTNSGNQGTWGLEGYYDDVLNGTDGREYGYLSDVSDFERILVEAEDGYNVVSTIDLNIQRIVEKYAEDVVKNQGCSNIGIVVADPNNGEILAMTDGMGYNLNDPRNLSGYYTKKEIAEMSDEETVVALSKMWRNFCVSDAYEAGSTFKPITVGAALDEATVSKDDKFECDGGEDLDDSGNTVRIYCHNRTGHGDVTLEESLMWSCNDALMQVGSTLGYDQMLKYMRLFGIGQMTGIDLPGEANTASLVFNESTMGSFELATSSFGQGFNLTMVQMVAAFSSIVNGGHYYQPHIVKEITNNSGNIVKSFDKVLIRNTFSEDTCNWLKDAMYKTVNDDDYYTTGTKAQLIGYNVGGKTGTAEKLPRGSGKYIVSFIGFAPVEDPQVVVYVVIDELTDAQEDSGVPTQIAGEILSEVLPYLQVFNSEGYDYTIYDWDSKVERESEDNDANSYDDENYSYEEYDYDDYGYEDYSEAYDYEY